MLGDPDSRAGLSTPGRGPGRGGWFAGELLLVLALVAGDYFELVPWSSTPPFLALGWVSLRLRGLRWRDVGLRRPPSWPRALAVGTAAGAALELLSTFLTVPLLSRLAGQPPDLSDFQPLVGNLKLVLVFLLPLWLGSAAEELVYRGYLMHRFADLGGRRPGNGWWLASLLAVSALFGWGHGGQGLTGMIQEGFAGAILGALFLACRRNLTVPIVAHAASNTLAFVLIYLDRYPGV